MGKKKTDPKKTDLKKADVTKSAPKKSAPRKGVGNGSDPKKAARNGSAPKKGAPKKSAPKKTIDAKTIRADLLTALGDQAFVRISRHIPRSDRLDGFVVGVGRTWVLLALLDLNWVSLDGLVALRTADVTKVERRGRRDDFLGKALVLQGEWPPATPDEGMDLDHVDGFLHAAQRMFPLVALFNEADHPDECVIGQLVDVAPRSVTLLKITPEATWYDRTTKVPLAAVSRVDVGDRYQAALLAVGGRPPTLVRQEE